MADPHARATQAATAIATPGRDTIPGTTIRFFISSTFSDFRVERDVLQRRVFPELRQVCAAAGFRLQPIDLRWGVSEAAGTDRQTLRICFDELERCRRLSPDFFLLILLGQRYGSHILPPQVPAALVARLLPRLTADQRHAFDAAYRLDENAVPPEYALLRAEGPEREEDERLRRALVGACHAAGVSAEDALLFSGSATHREIQLGLLDQPVPGQAQSPGATGIMGALRRLTGTGTRMSTRADRETPGVLCALRSFTGEPRGDAAARFVESDGERAGQMRGLTAAVLGRLSEGQVLRYEVAWRGEQGPAWDEEALARRYLGFLRPRIESIIAARTAVRAAAAAQGRDAVALANAAFERERAPRMEGRNAELGRVTDYLAGKSGAGAALVVTGAAGSGKSTLLAEAVTRAATTQAGSVRITRYIGVTPGTGTLRELLEDLRRAIALAYGQPRPETSTDENQLVDAVASLLATLKAPADRPLLLVLDALDQLSAQTQRTDWLPAHLAPHVRVVVSVLADRPELGYLRRRLPAEQIVALAPLDREAGQRMLGDLLATAPARTLTRDQEQAALTAFAAQGLPLSLRLLAGEARRWRSFDPPTLGSSNSPATLPPSTPELLQAILARLEQPERHGRMLVARSLGDLAAARLGLAEDELLDLLAGDGDVRTEQHTLSPSSPRIEEDLPLPVALWAELYAELAPLLSERDVEGGTRLYTFYHRQFREAVEARYLAGAERATRHRALADYFARQAWRPGTDRWNWRKADELVTQLEGAGDRQAAERALNALADELEHEPNAQAEDPAHIAVLIDALQDRIYAGGYWRPGRRLMARLLAAQRARQPGGAQEAFMLNALGVLAQNQDQYAEAARYGEEALAIARKVGNRVEEELALNNLGQLARKQGRRVAAARYYEQSLVIARELRNRGDEAMLVNNLGVVAHEQGQQVEAIRYYEQALAIARELGNRTFECHGLLNLGNMAGDQGRLADAAAYYEQALAIARELGNYHDEGTILTLLGNQAYVKGQKDEAARYYERAAAIARELSSPVDEARVLNNLGQLARQQGRIGEAAEYFERALTIFRAAGSEGDAGTILNNLGELALDQGRPRDTRRYYDEALALARRFGNRRAEGQALMYFGNLALVEGRHDEAARYDEQALGIFHELGDRTNEAGMLYELGSLADGTGRIGDAIGYFQRALEIAREVGHRAGEKGTLTILGELARKQGRMAQAQAYFEEAQAITE